MNSYRKMLPLLVVLAGLLTGLPACNNTHSQDYYAAQLTHFGFDSFPDFEDYTFYIDNFGHRIYNLDSLPFLSEVDSLFPTITAVSTNDEIYIDGELWKVKEIRDWSKSPVRLSNTSEDGRYTSTYDVYVNIHQVDPDSMQAVSLSTQYPAAVRDHKVLAADAGFCVYFLNADSSFVRSSSADGSVWSAQEVCQGLDSTALACSLSEFGDSLYIVTQSGKMLASADGLSWSAVADTTPVWGLFGTLSGRKYLSEDALTGIVSDTAGVWHFGRYESEWMLGDTLPADFPVRGFATTASRTVTDVEFLLVTTGLNRSNAYSNGCWATMDGLYWATTASSLSTVTPREGAQLFYYQDELYLYGGCTDDGCTDNTLYCSANHGIDWETAEDKMQLTAVGEGLGYAQVITDGTYIRIFGGNSGSQVWKAFLNKALFLR